MNIEQFLSGIRATESGSTSGNYTLRNSKSGAYGAYQFLERFWGDFLRYAKSAGYTPKSKSWPPNREAQDTVFRGITEYYLGKYGGNFDLVAVAWHCGHTCADAAVKRYGVRATPNQINQAVGDAKGGVHTNEIAYIRNVYQKQGLDFDPNGIGTAQYTEPTDGTTGASTMTLRNGDRGEEVTNLQKALVDAGHSIAVDGVFGPKTEAALKKYQQDKGLNADGIAGLDTLGALGLATNTGSSSGGGSSLNLPGNALLWYDSSTSQYLVVYEVPGVRKPDGTMTEKLYTAWTVESEADLEAIVGVGVKPSPARTVTQDELTQLGVVNFGGVDEFRNFEHIEGDPFDTWVEDMETLAITQPWVLDPEWARLSIMAVMERDNAQLSEAELRATEWWRTHSETERRWMELSNADPATATQWINDSRNATMRKLKAAGVENITPEISNWIADQVTTGKWTKDYLENQITALADPFANIAVSPDLLGEMAAREFSPGRTQDKESDVRALLQKWLGPVYGDWDDSQIAEKAGEFRNDPDSETNFVEWLKDQRVATMPGISDREVSYQDLAQPWKTFGKRVWGQDMDETDPIFMQMVANNDNAENGKLLTKEGLKRNIGQVVDSTRSAVIEAFGGSTY